MGNHTSRSVFDSGISDFSRTSSFHPKISKLSSTSYSKYARPKPLKTSLEMHRQHALHYLLKHVFQTSHFAPVDSLLVHKETRVLDVGAGLTATWCLDMAMDFPSAHFVGIDMEVILESNRHSFRHIPSNLHSISHNMLQGLPYTDNTFDYVHKRMIYTYYPEEVASFLLEELWRVTKPNGYIELVEYDIKPYRAGPLFYKLSETYGYLGDCLKSTLAEVGLRDIKSDYCSIPVCWGGSVGKLMYQNILILYKHAGPCFWDELGLKGDNLQANFDDYLDRAFDECVEYQTYFNFHWAWGIKECHLSHPSA
ncbi:S-adenosyl-L-methionine-dependent methyltransferase [Spinellus fusiger]|nr:S-adenosyl-L-methionine-dependent methyltransferase [Spinellus fusiger]